MTMRIVLDVVSAVCIGLLIGVEFAVSAFINPIVRKLGEREELRAIRLFAAKLGRVMPVWYGFSFVFLIAETIVRHGQFGVTLLTVASSIWAAVMLLTILFLVPINNRMVTLDVDALAGSAESALTEHGRWDAMHRWRVASLTAAMICFLLAIVNRP